LPLLQDKKLAQKDILMIFIHLVVKSLIMKTELAG
jgi:hypothetical protein